MRSLCCQPLRMLMPATPALPPVHVPLDRSYLVAVGAHAVYVSFMGTKQVSCWAGGRGARAESQQGALCGAAQFRAMQRNAAEQCGVLIAEIPLQLRLWRVHTKCAVQLYPALPVQCAPLSACAAGSRCGG